MTFVSFLQHKSGLNLSFFAPVHEQEVQNLLEEPDQFNREFEEFLAELASESTSLAVMDGSEGVRSQLESVSRQIVKDAATARGLGGMLANDKEIRFLYFNKMNLAIKAQLSSTIGKGGITMGSEMALSLLDIKSDFDRYDFCT